MRWFKKPELSVVVVVHRMRREAPRTLYSLSAAYQHGVRGAEYEVIVVENPSDHMLAPEEAPAYGKQFRYFVNPCSSVSPSAAVNFGARQARGRAIMVMVDGARIASPGVLRQTLRAMKLYDRPVVTTLAWHLGPDNQARSIHRGYGQEVEDGLLTESKWKADGYRLFDIAAFAGSCERGWFLPISESNCLTLSQDRFWALGGYSEEFQTPGGGFVNLDFYTRAVADAQRNLVVLLGEGTFHQVHGGVATNRLTDEPLREFEREYRALRGRPYTAPQTSPVFLGSLPKAARHFMRRSVTAAEQFHRSHHPSVAVRMSPDVGAAPRTLRLFEPARSAPSSTQFVTVLGMHRSGTSSLAGTLMECGVDFGRVSRWNPFNRKGNNENQKIMDLHERLLADNGGSWNQPPLEVRWSPEHLEQRDAILADFEDRGSAWCGFKDPRTLFALEGWRESLPHMRLVGIFRHPQRVAESLATRNEFPRNQSLEIWAHYNRRLLQIHRQQPFPILYFSENPEQYYEQLEGVVQLLGLKTPANGFEFFEPALRHSSAAGEEPLPAEIENLYFQLHGLAFYHLKAQRAGTAARAA